jgi:hypothetical protein
VRGEDTSLRQSFKTLERVIDKHPILVSRDVAFFGRLWCRSYKQFKRYKISKKLDKNKLEENYGFSDRRQGIRQSWKCRQWSECLQKWQPVVRECAPNQHHEKSCTISNHPALAVILLDDPPRSKI